MRKYQFEYDASVLEYLNIALAYNLLHNEINKMDRELKKSVLYRKLFPNV